MPKIGKWSRTLDVNDGATAYTVNQRGAGGIVDFQAGGVSKFSVTATAIVCGLPITGGDQAWADVGDMTFHAGSILKSGSVNGDTLLIAANDTTFITLTTGATDSCTIASPTITTPIIASLYQVSGGGLLSVPASVGIDTFCLLGAQQELDNKTLDASVAKGTWTASGTWTIPAVTLGGAVSGGGQALNAIGSIVFNATAATITTVATDGATFLLVAKNTAAQTQIVASVTGNATIASSTFDILVTPRFKAQSQSNYMTFTKAADVAARIVIFPDASFTVAGQNIDNAFSVDQTFAGNILFSTTAKGIYSVPSDAGTLLVVARNTAGQTQTVLTVQNAATISQSYLKLNADVMSDRWLSSLTNTFFGSGVVGAGNLAHTVGGEGWFNTYFGQAAGYSNTIGSQNAFFGHNAGYNNTTGVINTFLGDNAGYNNTTGGFNTFLGVNAGYNAGVALQTNSNCVFLGYQANTSVNALTNCIVIGSTAQGTASNQVTLGNASITQTILHGTVDLDNGASIRTAAVDAATLLFVARNTAGGTQTVGTVVGAATVANSYMTFQVGGTWTLASGQTWKIPPVTITAGSPGAYSADATARLMIEDDTNASISIIVPNTAFGGLIVGQPDAIANAYLLYYGSAADPANTWVFRTAAQDQLKISLNTWAFQVATTINSTSTLTVAASSVSFKGGTSGVVTVQPAAEAGTWTMTLPTAVGTAGYQLTDAAGDGITSWAAAASKREWKNILGTELSISPSEALDRILGTKVYPFTFKDGFGTGDTKTIYQGIIADEAPWAMHFEGSILNPITTFGYTVLAIQAMESRIKELERRLAV